MFLVWKLWLPFLINTLLLLLLLFGMLLVDTDGDILFEEDGDEFREELLCDDLCVDELDGGWYMRDILNFFI